MTVASGAGCRRRNRRRDWRRLRRLWRREWRRCWRRRWWLGGGRSALRRRRGARRFVSLLSRQRRPAGAPAVARGPRGDVGGLPHHDDGSARGDPHARHCRSDAARAQRRPVASARVDAFDAWVTAGMIAGSCQATSDAGVPDAGPIHSARRRHRRPALRRLGLRGEQVRQLPRRPTGRRRDHAPALPGRLPGHRAGLPRRDRRSALGDPRARRQPARCLRPAAPRPPRPS